MPTEMGKVLQVERFVLEKNPPNSDAFAEAYLIYSSWEWGLQRHLWSQPNLRCALLSLALFSNLFIFN